MSDVLSKPLSGEAKEKLVQFVEVAINSLRGQKFSETSNQAAKTKCIECLQTDIDMAMVFVTISSVYSPWGQKLVKSALDGLVSARNTAEIIVGIIEKSRAIDLSSRTN